MRALRPTAVPLRARSRVVLCLASLLGVAAVCWPLFISPDSVLAHRPESPWLLALLLPVVLAVVLAEISAGGLDAKAVAMLGVLSALGAALRPLGAGTAGIETVFFVLVLGGRVFGPGFGFVLGNTTLFTSALLTAGMGPWLPYQMLGAAWLGLGAGLLPALRGRWEIVLLAGYSALASLGYGLVMNLSFWPFAAGGAGTAASTLAYVPGAPLDDNLTRLFGFVLATSLGWDVGRAITTSALVLVTAPIGLGILRRAARRATFTAPPPGMGKVR